MTAGACHCGAGRVEIPRRPRSLTSCNCSICRRYGTLWAYCRAAEVKVLAQPRATDAYVWGDRTRRFVRCRTCGRIVNWEKLAPTAESRVGVDARLFDPDAMGPVRIRRLDGASTWKSLQDAPEDLAAHRLVYGRIRPACSRRNGAAGARGAEAASALARRNRTRSGRVA